MHRTTKSVLFLALALSTAACSPLVTTHGNMLSQTAIAEIQPTVSTRADVQAKWGPPTTTSNFDPNTWYYIGETDSRKGIFEAEVEKRQMIKVTFGADDIVTGVTMLDPKLGQEIDFADRKTPSAGKEYTVFQQAIGNIGKFNPNAGKK